MQPGRPDTMKMYHYTNKAGYYRIRASVNWCFKAYQPLPRDHLFGAYFTTLGPRTSKAKLAQLFIPNAKREYVFVFEDLGDLKPLRGGRGQYVYYSPVDYMVERARQIDSGARSAVAAREQAVEESET